MFHLRVLGLPYGGPYDGRDRHGTYFSPRTDFWLDKLPLPLVLRRHSLGEREPRVIGRSVAYERRSDGVWFDVELDETRENRGLYDAATRGELRASSGAVAHLVRPPDPIPGEKRVWPVAELSLCYANEASNPYAVALPQVRAAYQSIGKEFAMWVWDEVVKQYVWIGEGLGPVRGAMPPSGPPPGGPPSGPPGDAGRGASVGMPVGGSGGAPVQEGAGSPPALSEEPTAVPRVELPAELVAAAVDFLRRPVGAGAPAGARSAPLPAVIQNRGELDLWASGTPFVSAVRALAQGRFKRVVFEFYPTYDEQGGRLDGLRALTTLTGSGGGYIVPAEYSQEFVEALTAATAVLRAGARVWPMNSGTLVIPKKTGSASAYWMGESSEISDSAPTFGDITLIAKKVAALTKIPSELIEDASPLAEQIVREDLIDVLSREIDDVALHGTGDNNEPTGLLNIAGVHVDPNTLGANGSVWDFDDASVMAYALDADNIPDDGRAWIMHPRTVKGLRELKKNSEANHYAWADPLAPGYPPTIWGYPVLTTTSIPINLTQGTSTDCSRVYFGRWPELIVGQRKFIELKISDQAGDSFQRDQVYVRAVARIDINTRHAEAFEVMVGAR